MKVYLDICIKYLCCIDDFFLPNVDSKTRVTPPPLLKFHVLQISVKCIMQFILFYFIFFSLKVIGKNYDIISGTGYIYHQV